MKPKPFGRPLSVGEVGAVSWDPQARSWLARDLRLGLARLQHALQPFLALLPRTHNPWPAVHSSEHRSRSRAEGHGATPLLFIATRPRHANASQCIHSHGHKTGCLHSPTNITTPNKKVTHRHHSQKSPAPGAEHGVCISIPNAIIFAHTYTNVHNS